MNLAVEKWIDLLLDLGVIEEGARKEKWERIFWKKDHEKEAGSRNYQIFV